jgi:hypothetical protein
VEFNPSRSIDPDGSTLCSPELIDDLVIAVIRFLGMHTVVPIWVTDHKTGETVLENPDLWPPNWRQSVEVNRLDGARDIYSPFVGFGTRSLLGIKKPHIPTDKDLHRLWCRGFLSLHSFVLGLARPAFLGCWAEAAPDSCFWALAGHNGVTFLNFVKKR